MIPFNRPTTVGHELNYVKEAIAAGRFSGDGPFTKRCQTWLERFIGAPRALLTPSCTAALEMAAILSGVRPGDEVIMPSYTFPSTANAFVLRGATPVFVDIKPQTFNINGEIIEAAITPHTRAVVVVHYGGFACDMDPIMAVANRHGLRVIEDAAQALMARYKGRYLGTIGDFGCISFHETKNIHCGEGGALLINDRSAIERAEIIREKGTNRLQFIRGEVDKYGWVDIGSSYLPSELNAAFLLAQLEQAPLITESRRLRWQTYFQWLEPLAEGGTIEIRSMPTQFEHNGHLFYLKLRDRTHRDAMIAHLKKMGIAATFHYTPLHSASAGTRYGRFHGADEWTTRESNRLVRLPLYHSLTSTEQDTILNAVYEFLQRGTLVREPKVLRAAAL
jgi:dTDP-4-amino-4,6-dideoxygalactose transaminase